MTEPREGECRDISPGGMFILTPRPSPRGALIRFECAADVADDYFRGTGRVVWQRNKSDPRGPAGMGVRFVRLEADGREAVERIVERALIERQRNRTDSDRRTSSGPPPRVRASDTAAQPFAILATPGEPSPGTRQIIDSALMRRSPTLRGVAATRPESSPPQPKAAPRSPLPPSPLPASPTVEVAANKPISSSPPARASRAPADPSPWPSPRPPPRSPLPPRPAAATRRNAGPSPLLPRSLSPGAATGTLRERLDRTRRGASLGSNGPAAPERSVPLSPTGDSSRPPPESLSARTGHPGAGDSDRPSRVTSDRPPGPGRTDDLRAQAARPVAPGSDPGERAPSATTVREAASRVTLPSGDDEHALDETPFMLPDVDRHSEGSRWMLWVILGTGLAAAAGLARVFGGGTVGAGQEVVSHPEPAPSPAASAPKAPPAPLPAPAAAAPASAAPTHAAHAGQPAASAPTLGSGSSQALAPPNNEPPRGSSAGSSSTHEAPHAPPSGVPHTSSHGPARAAQTTALSGVEPSQPPRASAPSPAPPEPSPTPAPAIQPSAPPQAPPAARPAPAAADAPQARLQQALDCLSRGDNDCVVRVLKDKASSARELELLIATYRAMGEQPRAERAMNRYLESYPAGSHAVEYRRLLKRQAPAAEGTPP